MKKVLFLICLQLVTIGLLADPVEINTVPDVSAFNDNANVYYIGVKIPGSSADTYALKGISIYENTGFVSVVGPRYVAFAIVPPSNNKLDEQSVLGISQENPTPIEAGFVDYTFASSIMVKGGSTYYVVFLNNNTAEAGILTAGLQRIRLINHSTYDPAVCLASGEVRNDLIPGLKISLNTNELVQVDGLYYTLSETEATVIGGSNSVSFDIPASITLNDKSYAVTCIGSQAFLNCSNLTSINIPSSVTTIGHSAFYGCSSLQSVVIGNGVTHIYSNSLRTEKPLKSLTIGSGVLSIDDHALSYAPIKTIWLTNTPPAGYSNVSGTINYVANDFYTSLSNRIVYPSLSSMFVVDGVKYVPVSPSEKTCDAIDCIYGESVKNINIGKSVSYKGVEMTVKQVNPYAFYGNSYIMNVALSLNGDVMNNTFQECSALQSVTLGEEITSLGAYAFDNCSSLQSIVIPDAVLTIGNNSFQNCSSMSSVKIGKGLKTIGTYAFSGCSALSSFYIPSAVNEIGDYAFNSCTELKNIIIDDRESFLALGSNGSNPLFSSCPLDSVYIGGNISYNISSNNGYSPFYHNTSLRVVTTTDKVTEISPNEFYGCTNLKNVRIGNGVSTIGNWAFSGCSSLDYFAFGKKVAVIGEEAFSDCTNVTNIISHAETPPTCGTGALDDINKWNCKLTIPTGHLAAYQSADQWKEFFFMEEGEGSDIPVIPDTKKCAKPEIYYSNGKLTFVSETEEVVYQSTITNTDITSYSSDEIQLGVTYDISVYATKPGYEDSDIAIATLCWIDVAPQTEGIVEDVITGVKEQHALPVLIQTENKTVTVSGADDGTCVTVYGIDGSKVGSDVSSYGRAQVGVKLPLGSVAVVKIGEKAVKVVVK